MDSSDPRTLEATRKLQILQQIAVPSNEKGKLNPAEGRPVYVGITQHPSNRVDVIKEKSDKKEQKEVMKNDSGIEKGVKENGEKE